MEESNVWTGPNNGPIKGTCNEISNEVTRIVLESYFNLVIVVRSGLVQFRVRTLVVVMHVLVLLINPEGTLMKSGQSAQNEFVKSNRGRVSISRSNVMNRCTCATRGREKQKRNDEEWERGDVVPFTPSNIGIHKSTVIVVVWIHARQTFLLPLESWKIDESTRRLSSPRFFPGRGNTQLRERETIRRRPKRTRWSTAWSWTHIDDFWTTLCPIRKRSIFLWWGEGGRSDEIIKSWKNDEMISVRRRIEQREIFKSNQQRHFYPVFYFLSFRSSCSFKKKIRKNNWRRI